MGKGIVGFVVFSLLGISVAGLAFFADPTGDRIHTSTANAGAFAALLVGIGMGWHAGRNHND